MPPAPSREEQVLDALKATLQTIGIPPSSWATVPVVAEGVPGDVLPDPETPRIYLEYVRTELREPFSAVNLDHVRLHYVAYLAARTLRLLMAVKRDVRTSIKASMDSMTTSFGQPAWLGDFERDGELLRLKQAGIEAGAQSIFIDLTVDYSSA